MSTAVNAPLERYFYHSFPRRQRSSDLEIEAGCKILALIRDVGFLLTPEPVRWEYPHADGSPPRRQQMVQRRISFTELSPCELATHGDEFGHFALEFDIDTLKNLGAIPVFYIPRNSESQFAASLGGTIVMQIIDAMCLIDRIAQVNQFIESSSVGGSRQNFVFGFTDVQKLFSLDIDETQKCLAAISYGVAPAQMISSFLEGALNFFYPADDDRTDGVLKYYRQREWRISGNIATKGSELMQRPSDDLIKALLELDAEFYGKKFPPEGVTVTNPSSKHLASGRLVDWTSVYPAIAGKRIIEFVRRIIVPREAVEKTKAIISQLTTPPPVISLEELAIGNKSNSA